MKPAASSRPWSDSRRQLQGRDPALGAPLQRGDVPAVQIEPDDLVEVRRHLVEGEPQVRSAKLDQLAACPQPRERQVGIGARADHQVDVRWEVLEQERHVRGDPRTVGEVVVVEHQVEPGGQRAELVEHGGEDGADRRMWCLEQRQRRGAHPGRRGVQRGHDVGPERVGLSLGLLERHPRHRALRTGGVQPCRQQRRLPETGRRRDQSQPRPRCPAQAFGSGWGAHTRSRRGLGTKSLVRSKGLATTAPLTGLHEMSRD